MNGRKNTLINKAGKAKTTALLLVSTQVGIYLKSEPATMLSQQRKADGEEWVLAEFRYLDTGAR